MADHSEEVGGQPAQDRVAILNMLSEVHEALVAYDLPEAAKHVAAAKRAIERKR